MNAPTIIPKYVLEEFVISIQFGDNSGMQSNGRAENDGFDYCTLYFTIFSVHRR